MESTVKSDASGNVTISSTDTNTTYSNFTRTVSGLVPAPGLTTTTRYLREDGGRVVPPNTVYSHPTTAGNKHIPSGGSSGQFLKWSASGTAVWAADNNTVYSHPTTAGNKHIPTGGATNQILRWSSSGTAVWSNENTGSSYTHPTTDGNKHVPATGTTNGGKVLKAGSTAKTFSWGYFRTADVGEGQLLLVILIVIWWKLLVHKLLRGQKLFLVR